MNRAISLLNYVPFLDRLSLGVRRHSAGWFRRAIWNTEYSIGRWSYLDKLDSGGVNRMIAVYVNRYVRGGCILDVGCGTGHVAHKLNPADYSLYTGVDVSTVAIEAAQAHGDETYRAKTRFIAADATRFTPPGTYALILLKEVLYYLNATQIRNLLARLSATLTETGVFVGINYERELYHWITDVIEADYTVLERYCPPESKLIALVFRAR